jgi:hypothetical protein
MRITIELDIRHSDGTGRDDPERVAEFVYWNLLDNKTIKAGNQGDARYFVHGYDFVSDVPETNEDGESIDVLPEP